ncbi:amidohydrolase family protein [uncultured Jannaschia sp.]|uniref:amidohydrolase family protein n=1 Tax=uncultured Jannaschia sp. TaxID=293347 RepID=UPI00262E4B6E|nr:amidohydrolase family protein [uncultured Jannaschia sp.]
MIVDAHQHFWRLDRGDYGWLTPEAGPIYRDFGPGDLRPLMGANGVGGTILVQAAPSTAETAFLLDIAGREAFVRGVVGWVDFEGPDAPAEIARFAADPKLVGLRPMIQDIADDDWMLRPDLAPAFAAMVAQDLTFDALVFPCHLGRLETLIARHPDLRVVIDHGAKPRIAEGAFDEWAGDMTRLARETPAFCKLSGLVTEAGEEWTPGDLAPYVAHLIEIFGPDRLLWGSDWPVATLACDYGTWLAIARDLVGDADAWDTISQKTVTRAYRLS